MQEVKITFCESAKLPMPNSLPLKQWDGGGRMVMTMTGARKGNGKGRLEAAENEEECGMLNRGVPF